MSPLTEASSQERATYILICGRVNLTDEGLLFALIDIIIQYDKHDYVFMCSSFTAIMYRNYSTLVRLQIHS